MMRYITEDRLRSRSHRVSSSLTFSRNFCGKCTWDSASSCCTDALTLLENELLGKLPTGWLRSMLNDVKCIDKSAPWRQSTVAGKSVCSMNCHGPGQAPASQCPQQTSWCLWTRIPPYAARFRRGSVAPRWRSSRHTHRRPW